MTKTDAKQPSPQVQSAPLPKAAEASEWNPPKRNFFSRLLMGASLTAAALTILYAWQLPPFDNGVEETNNANVQGRTTIISPQVSGYVAVVPVKDFQHVRAGEMLARIDDATYAARVEQARANVLVQIANYSNSTQAEHSGKASELSQTATIAGAEAQLTRAQADWNRLEPLVKAGWATRAQEDQARAALRQSEAQVKQAYAAFEIARQNVRSVIVGRDGLSAAVKSARAQAHAAEIDLAYTVIRAPEAGTLSDIGVHVGQFVSAGTQLMFLVPEQSWVIANFKEAQTHRMRVGQPASLRIDALGGARLKGHVESLAPATGSQFAVLKPDNATGNFVKVAQRIAIRIVIDRGQALSSRLRPGMSVEARVDTRE
jgi:multidrug resistance efflux pump